MIKKIATIFAMLAVLAVPVLQTVTVSAVDVVGQDVCDRARAQNSTVCKDNAGLNDKNGEQKNPIFGNDGVLTTIINLLTAVVGIIAIIMIILAGLKMVTSGTNSQDVNTARERIIYALIALVVVALAQALVRFIINKIGSD